MNRLVAERLFVRGLAFPFAQRQAAVEAEAVGALDA
jgi:hypothetical protein